MRNVGERKGIICLVTMFLMFSMALVACGREKEITAEDIIGYWTVSNVDCNSEYIKDNPDIMDRFYETVISLNDDGTGKSEFLGEKNDVTWKEIDKEHIELYLADGSIYHELYFASKDNTLVWDEKNDLLYAQIILSKTSNFKSDATDSDKSMTETKEVLAEDSLSIDTDYYSISLPTEWKDQYSYFVYESGMEVTLYEKNDHELNGKGFLAQISMVEFGTVENEFQNESYWYSRQYLGTMEIHDTSYHLIAEYSHEAGECSDENYEQYLVMIQGIETGALRNITAKDGVTFTEMTEPKPLSHYLHENETYILSGSFLNYDGDIISFFPRQSSFIETVDIMVYQDYLGTAELVSMEYGKYSYTGTVEYSGKNFSFILYKNEQEQRIEIPDLTFQKLDYSGNYAKQESILEIPFVNKNAGVIGGYLSNSDMQGWMNYEYPDLSAYHLADIGENTEYFASQDGLHLTGIKDSTNILYMDTINTANGYQTVQTIIDRYEIFDIAPLIITSSQDNQTMIWAFNDAYLILNTSVWSDGGYADNYLNSYILANKGSYQIVY